MQDASSEKKSTKRGKRKTQDKKLVGQLLQYKMYKYMSYELRDRQIDGERMMFKGPDIPEEVKTYQQPFDLDELLDGTYFGKTESDI